jgi:hypothetical protein
MGKAQSAAKGNRVARGFRDLMVLLSGSGSKNKPVFYRRRRMVPLPGAMVSRGP